MGVRHRDPPWAGRNARSDVMPPPKVRASLADKPEFPKRLRAPCRWPEMADVSEGLRLHDTRRPSDERRRSRGDHEAAVASGLWKVVESRPASANARIRPRSAKAEPACRSGSKRSWGSVHPAGEHVDAVERSGQAPRPSLLRWGATAT